MSHLMLTLFLFSFAQAMVIIPQGVEDAIRESSPDTLSRCAHTQDTTYAVIAWPGNSCDADLPNFSTLATSTPYPLSCPATPFNSKCFPITEDPSYWEEIVPPSFSDSESDQQVQLELRRVKRSDNVPRSTPGPYSARSITLKWPDRMRHAVFYADDACQLADTEGGEVVGWHVEREGLRGQQCVPIESEGSFGSVEFMRQEEFEIWDKRRRGVDDGIGRTGWGWRGLL